MCGDLFDIACVGICSIMHLCGDLFDIACMGICSIMHLCEDLFDIACVGICSIKHLCGDLLMDISCVEGSLLHLQIWNIKDIFEP